MLILSSGKYLYLLSALELSMGLALTKVPDIYRGTFISKQDAHGV